MITLKKFSIDSLRLLSAGSNGPQISFSDCERAFKINVLGTNWVRHYGRRCANNQEFLSMKDAIKYLSHQHVFAHFSLLKRWEDDDV